MSDLRVDTAAIERKYKLLDQPGEELWNVTPIYSPAAKSKRVVTLDGAGGGAERIVRGIIRLFEAKTSSEHREAVELLEHDLLWDGPPIRLSNKGHMRMAAYLFKYFAHVNIFPVAAVVSEPAPGLHLIELDAVAVSHPHRPWLLPLTRLLPASVAKNVHLKIGVTGGLDGGKVELLIGRLTNWPPFLPFAWQRNIMGIAMGALPHTFEGPLGFLFDFADGGDYYAKKRYDQVTKRHPGTTNPNWDYLCDSISDTPGWLVEQGTVAVESLQAVTGRSFEGANDVVGAIISFYMWLFSTAWGLLSNLIESVTGNGASTGRSNPPYPSYQPGTAGLDKGGQYGGGATTGITGASDYKAAARTAPVVARPAARPVAASGGI